MIVVEDLIFAVVLLTGMGLISLRARALYREWRKHDPLVSAEAHRRDAEARLQAMRVEAEAARIEQEADRTLDQLYDTTHKENRHG